jgi:TonB family protein
MLKSPLPEPAMRAMGSVVAACLAVSAGGMAWAANPAAPAPNGTIQNRVAPTDPGAAARAFVTGPSPNWSRRPTLEELVKVYPAQAVKGNVEGDVVLHCQVTKTGKLADCSVLRETPQGMGFGAAALQLTPFFEARAQTPEGGPKRGRDVRIPVRFRLPRAAAPSAN